MDANLNKLVNMPVAELLRGEKGDPQISLYHIQADGRIFGVADNIRLEPGVAAGAEAQLEGDLAGLVEDKALVLQFGQPDAAALGEGMGLGDGEGVVVASPSL